MVRKEHHAQNDCVLEGSLEGTTSALEIEPQGRSSYLTHDGHSQTLILIPRASSHPASKLTLRKD